MIHELPAAYRREVRGDGYYQGPCMTCSVKDGRPGPPTKHRRRAPIRTCCDTVDDPKQHSLITRHEDRVTILKRIKVNPDRPDEVRAPEFDESDILGRVNLEDLPEGQDTAVAMVSCEGRDDGACNMASREHEHSPGLGLGAPVAEHWEGSTTAGKLPGTVRLFYVGPDSARAAASGKQ